MSRLLVLLLLTGCAHTPLEQLLRRYEDYGLSGAVVVSDGDRTLVNAAYGLADKERRIANTRATGFAIASVGKTFTAAAIVLLEKRGALRLDDPIERFVGPLPDDKKAITIRHLLAHTSGLVPNVWDANVPKEATREEMVAAVKSSTLLFAPGTKTRYSNTGFTLLAAIIEVATARPYKDFIRQEVLAPANLRETGFAEDALWRSVARGYAEPNDDVTGPQLPEPRSWGSHLGAGGFISTIGDMHRWLMLPHEPLGWFVEKTALGREIVFHDGHTPGFRANVVRFHARPLLIAFAVNDELVRMPIRDAVERVVFNEPYLIPPQPRAAPRIDPTLLVGTYALDSANQISVSIDNGVLQAGAIGQRAIDLLLGEVKSAPAVTQRSRQALAHPEGEFAEWWSEQCPAPAKAETRGSAPRSPATLQTFVACGDRMLRLVWTGEKLTGWGGGMKWAGTVPLRQYDADSFVAFENLLAQRVTRLIFRDGALFIDDVRLARR